MQRSRLFRISGFSLVELLVSLAIIGLVTVFMLPAVSTTLRGTQLSQASETMREQMSLARQYALTKNRTVEVRLIRYGDPEQPGEDAAKPATGRFRAIQLMELNPAGIALPISKRVQFPSSVVMNDQRLSSLLDQSIADKLTVQTPSASDPELPRVGRDYQFVAVHFRPNGSTDLNPTIPWFVTLHGATERQTDGSTPPPNYFTLQIDPVSGSCKGYRPNAG